MLYMILQYGLELALIQRILNDFKAILKLPFNTKFSNLMVKTLLSSIDWLVDVKFFLHTQFNFTRMKTWKLSIASVDFAL